MQNNSLPIRDRQFRSVASRALLHYVNKRFPRFFSEEEKEDMTSEVVLRMWRARGSYDGEKGALSTWVGTIARNVVLTAARAKSNRMDISGELEDGVYPDDQPWCRYRADEQAPDGNILMEQLEEGLFARLGSERDRRFLRWQVDGLTTKEMAEREGIPVDTVHMVLFRMRRRLLGAA